ncbi:hypothetical protein H1Q63_24625 [Desmonostoc muscorum CCALA 125]|nr:hypothetical protein [Desmonostoc muscorum CCALA 125]
MRNLFFQSVGCDSIPLTSNLKTTSLSTYRRLSYTIPKNKSFIAEIICIAALGVLPTDDVLSEYANN